MTGRSSVRRPGALSPRRQAAGFALAAAGLALLSVVMPPVLAHVAPGTVVPIAVLSFQLLVVAVAVVGGLVPALCAAVGAALAVDLLFVAPRFALEIADPAHAVILLLSVAIAALVSAIVDVAVRRARSARSSAAESALLASIASDALRAEPATPALLARSRAALGLDLLSLLDAEGTVLSQDPPDEPRPRTPPTAVVPVGDADGIRLEAHGSADPGAVRLLPAIAAQVAGVREREQLTALARSAEQVAQADAVRTALLAAVGHDLRRPLAAAMAAVGGLSAAPRLDDADRAALVATTAESLDALSRLITDLLDASRLQAGVVAVALMPVETPAIVLAALDELALGPREVDLLLEPEPPLVRADPVLLQRVVVNLLTNARHHGTPTTAHVRVAVGVDDTHVALHVIDQGPGVDPEHHARLFTAFHTHATPDQTPTPTSTRHDTRPRQEGGLGLGLTLSRGFTEGMGGTLTATQTPGGGLTMTVTLPRADAAAPPAEETA